MSQHTETSFPVVGHMVDTGEPIYQIENLGPLGLELPQHDGKPCLTCALNPLVDIAENLSEYLDWANSRMAQIKEVRIDSAELALALDIEKKDLELRCSVAQDHIESLNAMVARTVKAFTNEGN